MTPDRAALLDMDRRIAEKVMGWTWPLEHRLRENASQEEECSLCGWATWQDHRPCDGWSPTTNIAHAWEVVERLRHCAVVLRIDPHMGWTVALTRERVCESDVDAFGSGDTACLAVCRAALDAFRDK